MPFATQIKVKPFLPVFFFGGDNKNWGNTPMQKLYDYYIKEGKTEEDAHQAAAIDAGRLLKAVLERDSREFEIVGKDTGTLYKLV